MNSEYQILFDQIQKLSEKSASFRRVALHIHSPQSYDFGQADCDKNLNNKEQYLKKDGERAYLQHFVGNYDIIGITDHMRVSYACRLVEAAKKYSGICVLPGMEINLRLAPPLHELKMHVIVIFPNTKTVTEIERIFPPGMPGEEKRGGLEEVKIGNDCEFKDISQFVEKINQYGGLCIAAHVDSKNGIRFLFRQTGRETLELFNPDQIVNQEQQKELSEKFKAFLVAARFHGIEVSRPEDRKHYSWEVANDGKTIHIPVFLTFDAHNIEMVATLPRFTYIKTTELSWKGLADAIRFPQTRIRFSEDRVPPPYIMGIEIISPNCRGFFNNLQVGLIENLNCIIGPRGSGKSTIVDAFRYVFGYNRNLNELGNRDLVESIKSRQKATLLESRIRVIYRLADKSIQILEATYDPQSNYVTKVYSLDGEAIPVPDIEKAKNYPLRLFGWSEIENLGRDSQRQLELLDKLIEGIDELHKQKQDLINQLALNREEISRVANELAQIYTSEDSEVRRYQEYKVEFNRLNTSEVQTLFEELDLTRTHLAFVIKIYNIILAIKERVVEISFENLDITELDPTINKELLDWWTQIKQQLDFSLTITTIKQGITDALANFNSLTSQINQIKQQLEEGIKHLEDEIRNKVIADPSRQILADLRSQAKIRLDHVEEIRNSYNDLTKEFNILLSNRTVIIQKLRLIHRRISKVRLQKKQTIEECLNEYQSPDLQVTLQFENDGNRDALVNYLSSSTIFSSINRQFRARKWPEIIASRFSPIQFPQTILHHRISTLRLENNIEEKNYFIDNEDATEIVNACFPFGNDELAEIIVIDWTKLEFLLKMQEIDWDDNERILRNEKPIDKSSPGQRSSAMLPLIALSESVPLLIDQPEDNLDNRLVGNVLVEILAKLKERRQIIIATHNPNIVVLGDAEQVIILDAISDQQGCVEYQASIDDHKVIKRVIELMEGGINAFETRNTRYQNII